MTIYKKIRERIDNKILHNKKNLTSFKIIHIYSLLAVRTRKLLYEQILVHGTKLLHVLQAFKSISFVHHPKRDALDSEK